MVQDVKVSRQLDNVARLYRKLQKLQDGEVPGKGKGGPAYTGAVSEGDSVPEPDPSPWGNRNGFFPRTLETSSLRNQ